jgi:hypothetical protein
MRAFISAIVQFGGLQSYGGRWRSNFKKLQEANEW